MNQIKQPHPLCKLFPAMPDEELQDLARDIQANGLIQPICLEPGTELIMDGVHRYTACMAIGVEPRFLYFNGSEDQKLGFVMAMNFKRRHLTPGQRAAIVALAQDWEKAHARGGMRDNKINELQSATLHFDSAVSRAEKANVSPRTQKDADIVAKTSPDLAKQVADGKISLNQAVQQIKPRREPAERPAIAAPAQEAEPEEPEIDWRKEWEAESREVERLQRLLDELKENDAAKIAMEWESRFHALEGRNAQLNTTLQAAIKEAKSAQWANKQLRQIVGVDSNRELIERVKKLIQAGGMYAN